MAINVPNKFGLIISYLTILYGGYSKAFAQRLMRSIPCVTAKSIKSICFEERLDALVGLINIRLSCQSRKHFLYEKVGRPKSVGFSNGEFVWGGWCSDFIFANISDCFSFNNDRPKSVEMRRSNLECLHIDFSHRLN